MVEEHFLFIAINDWQDMVSYSKIWYAFDRLTVRRTDDKMTMPLPGDQTGMRNVEMLRMRGHLKHTLEQGILIGMLVFPPLGIKQASPNA